MCSVNTKKNLIFFLMAFYLASCGYFNIDPYSVYIRSDIITSPEIESKILSKAQLTWTDDNLVRVIYLRGTPYERGYQHGALLRTEISDNLPYLYRRALSKFHFGELFSEAFERARPFIPEEYMQEMLGLAHGSKLPLSLIHAIHILPEIGEWGGKREIKKVVKRMMDGELGTSCSNFCANDKATANNKFYTVRILDWGLHRISKLHKYPLIAVHLPDSGQAYANIGWVGFIGAISGINEQGITLGEMGYGNPEGETLRGMPMPFLLRNVLAQASNLSDVRRIISTTAPTCSYVFLMSDGKSKESELYIRDKDRFIVKRPGEEIKDRDNTMPAIEQVVYGGHYHDRMTELLTKFHGQLTPDIIMKQIIPQMAMPSNFQNVLYDPVKLAFWVSNAASIEQRAAEQPYTYFNLRSSLLEFRSATQASH